jgi:DNA polymerase-1
VRAVVGDNASQCLGSPAMRETVNRNRRLMRMRTDLPMPELDAARLPLDLAAMRRALAGRGINLGPSLWALTGGAAPPTEAEMVLVARPWAWSPRTRRDPAPGQLALF